MTLLIALVGTILARPPNASAQTYRKDSLEDPVPVASPLLVPFPAKPWGQATQIVGKKPRFRPGEIKDKALNFDRLPLYNDFCLVSDAAGHWHCIAYYMERTSANSYRDDRLIHYVADSLQGPYHSVGYVDLGYGEGTGVWAPCVLREKDRVLMFYARAPYQEQSAFEFIRNFSIRVAVARDAQLQTWQRPDTGMGILFTEPAARDPEVIRDQNTGQYLLYYVSLKNANYKDASESQETVVRVRTSKDLFSWSEPLTVLGTPPGYLGAESVFVLEKKGFYYMWISGAGDYSRMSLYISMDPFNFGDSVGNRIEEQSGHACEIIQTEGQYWMACVAIASIPGWFSQHDLEGVYLQPLEWRAATPEMLAKVVRGSALQRAAP